MAALSDYWAGAVLWTLLQLMADGTPAAQTDAAETAAALVPLTRLAGQPKGIAVLDRHWSDRLHGHATALVEMLRRPHLPTQFVAAEVLWHMCTWEAGCYMRDMMPTIPDSVHTIAQLLSSSSWQVARAAAGVLGNLWADTVLGVPGVVAQLVGVLGDERMDVRVQMYAACCLHTLVTSDAPHNAAAACQAVAAVPDVRQRLEMCASGDHNALKKYARQVLQQL